MTKNTPDVSKVMGLVTNAITHASGWKITEATHADHEAKIEAAAIAACNEARRPLVAAIRTMQAGLNSYHPDCINEGQCYCRALRAVARAALAAIEEPSHD